MSIQDDTLKTPYYTDGLTNGKRWLFFGIGVVLFIGAIIVLNNDISKDNKTWMYVAATAGVVGLVFALIGISNPTESKQSYKNRELNDDLSFLDLMGSLFTAGAY